MKCPACKMETPEEVGYCDFCKEPFRRKAPEPKPAEAVDVPAAVMGKLLDAKRAADAAPDGEAGGIPPEFAGLDAGERIPEVPPAARKLAWGFLAIVLFWGAFALFYAKTRVRRVPIPVGVIVPPGSPGAPAPTAPEPAPPPAQPEDHVPALIPPGPPTF